MKIQTGGIVKKMELNLSVLMDVVEKAIERDEKLKGRYKCIGRNSSCENSRSVYIDFYESGVKERVRTIRFSDHLRVNIKTVLVGDRTKVMNVESSVRNLLKGYEKERYYKLLNNI